MPPEDNFTYISPTGDPNRKIRVAKDSPLATMATQTPTQQQQNVGTVTTFAPAVMTSKPAREQTTEDLNKLAQINQPTTTPTPTPTPTKTPETNTDTSKYVFETDDGRTIYGSVNQYGDFVPDTAPESGSPEDIALKANKGVTRRVSGSELQASQMLSASERRLNTYLDEITRMSGKVDENLKSTLQSLTATYERRREEQRRLNQAVLGGSALMESRTGRARYAQQISQDILTKKEQEGLDQLASIDQQERVAVQAAQDAADEKKFGLLNKQIESIENLRREKQDLIFQLESNAREEETAMLNRAKFAMEEQQYMQEEADEYIKSSQEGAIMNLLAQGINDPVELYNLLNTDENGQPYGGINVSMEQIGTLMKAVKDSKSNPDKFKTIGGPKEGFYQLELDENGQVIGYTEIIAPSEGSDSNEFLSPAEVKALSDAGYNVTYGMTKGEAMAVGAPVSSGYSDAQVKKISQLNEQVSKNATYAKTSSMRNFANNVKAALGQGTGAGDIAAINQFQKVIDEGAVTRDQDVKLIQGAQSVSNRLKTQIAKLEKGEQLSTAQRAEMETLIDSIYDAQVKALENDPYIASKVREAELNDITISDTILGELSALGGPKPVPTTPVKQMSYPDLSSFLRMNPEWMDTAVEIQKNEDLSDRDLIEFMTSNFNGVGGDTKSATGKTPYLSTLGNVTGIDGSPLWKWGLDIDLKKGDPVKSPVSGKVLAVANNGGFGKQVKVRGADGNEYWFSHLDGYSVKVGDTINKGQVVGLGGNTGKTIALGGGDGSHLDLTVKDKNGNYIPPRQIKSLLDNILV